MVKFYYSTSLHVSRQPNQCPLMPVIALQGNLRVASLKISMASAQGRETQRRCRPGKHMHHAPAEESTWIGAQFSGHDVVTMCSAVAGCLAVTFGRTRLARPQVWHRLIRRSLSLSPLYVECSHAATFVARPVIGTYFDS